ncbi:MAG: hypothetical protein M3R02_30840 [Chloroflexota bacterium]|nr:hypothetical protein [Chloroflexota bacterium]
MTRKKEMRRRLDRIEEAIPPPPPPLPDLSRLTSDEWAEFGAIVRRCRPGEGPRPDSDRLGLWALSFEEVQRLRALRKKLLASGDT